MPYCLYVRKSRADAEAEARGEGETLTRHISILLEIAKKRGLDVTQIHREIVSGETIAARPIMQQLLTEVEQGIWDGVLVMEVERLARGDSIDQGIVAQTFKYSNTKIITPLKDYNPNDEFDEEYFEFGLFMSRREYKTINRRLQRGRLASVKEGKCVTSVAPYGYTRVRLEHDKGFTLKPLEGEAEIVKMIFELYTRGEKLSDGTYRRLGVSLIVRRLNAMHIKPKKSEHWSPATIRDMLTNPVYIGKIRWNWRPDNKKMIDGQIVNERHRNPPEKCDLYDGLHPALISKETFYKAQEYMSKNPPRPVGESKTVKNPLSGIVVCAKCGHKMVRRPYSNRSYGDTLICANTACDNVSSALHFVEERIIDALRDWLTNYTIELKDNDSLSSADSMVNIKETALQRLVKDYDTLKKQLANTHDFLEQGIYTTDQFLERSKLLSERIKQNEKDRAEIIIEIEKDKAQITARKQIVPKVSHLLDVYDSLPTAKAKNDLLQEVLEKVVYLKTKNGRWHNSPDDFELTVYPKIPLSM